MQPALAHWLQPHVVVELSTKCESERSKRVGSKLSETTNCVAKAVGHWEDTGVSARVHLNTHPGRSPIVRIHLKPTELKPLSSPDVNNVGTSTTSAMAARFHPGLPMSSSVCFSTAARTAFAANYEKEQRPRGGTVLRTRVQTDAATALCDAVFDRAFDGMVYYRVPDFPTSLMLPGTMQTEVCSPVRSCSVDSCSSRDQLNCIQQSQKQAVAPAVLVGAVQDATVHAKKAANSNHLGESDSVYDCREEPVSKAQQKKALKKLARAQAKARAKAKFEAAEAATDASSRSQLPSSTPVEATTAASASVPKAAAQQIGIIIGPSGCAKSVLLRLHFGCPVDTSAGGLHVWDDSSSIWSHFPVASQIEMLAVAEAFESVGLLQLQSSQRRSERTDSSWLCSVRYSELSQGERYLCDIAYLLIHCQLNRTTAAATAEAGMTGVRGPGKQYSDSWRGSGVLLLDEFTSCLDRRCARRLGAGLSKYCRKHAEVLPRVVVAGCHSDVIAPDAFVPDWVFEADTMTLHNLDPRAVAAVSTAAEAASDANHPNAEARTEHLGMCPGQEQQERARELLDVPVIKLRLRACSPAAWRNFREHHYKTQTLSVKARTFALTLESLHYSTDGSTDQRGVKPNLGMFEGICSAHCPVGFVATIPQSGSGVSDISPSITATSEGVGTAERLGCTGVPASATSRRRTEAWRAHRTVVLPAWQGLGIGSRLSDAAAALHHREGFDYYGQTVHPRFGAYRDSSPLWRGTLWNHSTQRFKIESWTQRTANTRVRLRTPRYVYSHYFVGTTQEPVDAARAALAGRVVFEGNGELA